MVLLQIRRQIIDYHFTRKVISTLQRVLKFCTVAFDLVVLGRRGNVEITKFRKYRLRVSRARIEHVFWYPRPSFCHVFEKRMVK